MIAFPNCKINLGLHITAKRPDGFHDLETIFYPVAWTEVIELTPLRPDAALTAPSPTLHLSGLQIDGDQRDNLCLRAYAVLKKDFPSLPPVQVYLHKAIPLGAGLGGGSSDGAAMLRLLDEKFRLGLSTERLLDYALPLWSD